MINFDLISILTIRKTSPNPTYINVLKLTHVFHLKISMTPKSIVLFCKDVLRFFVFTFVIRALQIILMELNLRAYI